MVGEFARVDGSIERLATNMADEFARVDARFDTLEEEIRAIRRDILDIDRRLTALEESIHDVRGYAKEIDFLHAEIRTLKERVARCEAR